MRGDTFTITADHLTLLSASEWRESDCEFGAPEMDPKRPYGNSSVELDLAELLIPGFRDLSDAEQERVLEAEMYRLVAVHRELPTVLSVATSAMSLVPGTYARVGRGPWSLVPAAPEPEPDPSDPRQIAIDLIHQNIREGAMRHVRIAVSEQCDLKALGREGYAAKCEEVREHIIRATVTVEIPDEVTP